MARIRRGADNPALPHRTTRRPDTHVRITDRRSRSEPPVRSRVLIVTVSACMSLIAAPAGAALGPRVLAGSQATSAQWPFIAALVQHGRSAFDGQFCGGSVIAPTVVLTAAHCVTGSSAGSIDVVTGRAQLSASQLGQRLAVLLDHGRPELQRQHRALRRRAAAARESHAGAGRRPSPVPPTPHS